MRLLEDRRKQSETHGKIISKHRQMLDEFHFPLKHFSNLAIPPSYKLCAYRSVTLRPQLTLSSPFSDYVPSLQHRACQSPKFALRKRRFFEKRKKFDDGKKTKLYITKYLDIWAYGLWTIEVGSRLLRSAVHA